MTPKYGKTSRIGLMANACLQHMSQVTPQEHRCQRHSCVVSSSMRDNLRFESADAILKPSLYKAWPVLHMDISLISGTLYPPTGLGSPSALLLIYIQLSP